MPYSINLDNRFPRRIALIDCNNFYVSCERVFNPQWQNKPVGVLSNNDGCIIARSNELKQAGIPMGAPYFKYRDQLDAMHAIVVSSNYTLYADMSARVMDILSSFTPSFEIYSIDEAWLDLTGFDLNMLETYSKTIVNQTSQSTGIPVSMGIGKTKTLAKLANRICKKNNIASSVFNIEDVSFQDSILESVCVEDVWGVGRRWAVKLKQDGVHTALDLKRSNPIQIRRKYNVMLQRLVYELNGISCFDLSFPEPKKQIIASRSFGVKVTDKQSILEAVALHATRAAEKLRLQHSVCGCLSVSIRTSPFSSKDPFFSKSALVRFSTVTSDTRELIAAAQAGVHRIFKQGLRYAKAGVVLLDISQQEAVQTSFFSHNDTQQSIQLMKTIDALNQGHGKHTVFFAAEGCKKTWAMNRQHMTQAYTTNWNELPIAYAK